MERRSYTRSMEDNIGIYMNLIQDNIASAGNLTKGKSYISLSA